MKKEVKKETKKAVIKKEEVKVTNEKEVFANLGKDLKAQICALIGQAFVTNKRVAIPKAIYDILDKEQRIAVRSLLDKAEACK